MQCEMCGKEGLLVRANIEGIELNVCKRCAKHGKVLQKPVEPKQVILPASRPMPVEEPTLLVVDDYAALIKKSREALGLKQEEFAKQINEKTSVIHNVESGKLRPSIELAKKLEGFLKIKLVEEYEEKKEISGKKSGEGLTIGDVLDLK